MATAGRKPHKEQLIVELFKARWKDLEVVKKEDFGIRDILYKLYVEEGKTQEELAEAMYISKAYVSKLMKKYVVQARKLTWSF